MRQYRVLLLLIVLLTFDVPRPVAAVAGVVNTIPVVNFAHAVAVNVMTNRIYVASSGILTVIDGNTSSVLTTLSAGLTGGWLAVNPVTNRIYLTHYTNLSVMSTVDVIDGNTNSVIAAVAVGSDPEGVAVNSLSNRIYVANYHDLTMDVIDGATNTVLAVIPLPGYPRGVAVNPLINRIYVTASKGNDSYTVSVIDGVSNQVVAVVPVDREPMGIAVNTATNRIYVANYMGYSVSVIDGLTNTVIGLPIRVGVYADGIDVNPNTNRIYVSNYGSKSVNVIDGKTGQVLGDAIPVQVEPVSVAVNPLTNRIYVANENWPSTVSVIREGPDVSASFGAAGIPIGVPTTLAIKLSNAAGFSEITDMGFILSLPTGMVLAAPPSAPQCAGEVVNNGTLITFSGVHLAAGPSVCILQLSVSSAIAGLYPFNQANLSALTLPINAFATSLSVFVPTVTPSPTVTMTARPSSTSTPSATATSKVWPIDTIGIYRYGTFYLRLSNSTGYADSTISFNSAGKPYPVVGDWTGSGFDRVGLFDQSDGLFMLCMANGSLQCASTRQFVFGSPGDQPLAGRWQAGVLAAGVGVFRPSNGLIYLKNNLVTGFADHVMVLGVPGDVGLAGDWDGKGYDSPGVYRPAQRTFYLSNQVTDGPVFGDYQVSYGLSGDMPLVGDWIGQGHDGIGLFRPTNGYTYLRNMLTVGYADNAFVYGQAGDVAVAGHWQSGLSGLIVQPSFISSPVVRVTPNSVNFDG